MTDTNKTIAELGPIADAIRRAGEERRLQGTKKLYIIFSEPYMHEGHEVSEFFGSPRELLFFLNNIEAEMMDHYVPFKVINGSRGAWLDAAAQLYPTATHQQQGEEEKFMLGDEEVAYWEGKEGYLHKPNKDFTNEELEELFRNANGDGQPYQVIYCLDDHKRVLQ